MCNYSFWPGQLLPDRGKEPKNLNSLNDACLLLFTESFGNDEGGIRKFARMEASEPKEGQRTVLRRSSITSGKQNGGEKVAMEAREITFEPVLLVTLKDI